MAYQATFKRYEIKYLLTQQQKEAVLQAMKPYMKLDGYGRTVIRNIYFDTGNFRLIRRSLEKPSYKEKLRIRSYQTAADDDSVFVELKKKYKSVVYKRRVSASYEDAMRCMLQCATTRTEEEVTRGIVRDDAAVVAQLRSMELMQRFPQEKVERCVQAASALSRPVLEKLGSAVPLQAQQIVIPMLAVGLCFELQPETVQLVADFVLSTITVKGQLSGILKTVLCHFQENYITVLEAYDPADHGMTPYTRREEL